MTWLACMNTILSRQYSDDMGRIRRIKLIEIVLAILVSGSMLLGIPNGSVGASDGETMLVIDVWTNKGGEGFEAYGGTYEVGEETVLYVRANLSCRLEWFVSGPSVVNSGEQEMQGGRTYEWVLGEAEETDIGHWEISFGHEGSGQYDFISFDVVAAEAEPESEPEIEPTPSVTEEDSATQGDSTVNSNGNNGMVGETDDTGNGISVPLNVPVIIGIYQIIGLIIIGAWFLD